MPNIRSLSLAITAACILHGCSSPVDTPQESPPYTNVQAVQEVFKQHRGEFNSVKDYLLKEPIDKLIYTPKLQSRESENVSKTTLDACDKLMETVNAHAIIKLYTAVRFELNSAREQNKVKNWSIIYDPQRMITHPQSKFGVERSLQELEPNWYFVSDSINTTNYPIRLQPAEVKHKPQQ